MSKVVEHARLFFQAVEKKVDRTVTGEQRALEADRQLEQIQSELHNWVDAHVIVRTTSDPTHTRAWSEGTMNTCCTQFALFLIHHTRCLGRSLNAVDCVNDDNVEALKSKWTDYVTLEMPFLRRGWRNKTYRAGANASNTGQHRTLATTNALINVPFLMVRARDALEALPRRQRCS